MFRRLFRHIKEGFIGIKRHFAMALSSASAVMITLSIVGVFAVLMVNVSYLTKEIESSISLVALIDYKVEDSVQINNMKSKILAMDGVSTVEYRTKEEEFDFYNETYPDMVEFSELYRNDNPFHDTFVVYMSEGAVMTNIKDDIAKISGISSVEDGGNNTYTLISVLSSIRTFGTVLVLSLVILAVYLIYNTIKITISTRKDEIWIMRNVGAKNSYIRAPFMVEGILIGIMGSIVPIGLVLWGYIYLFNLTDGNLAGVMTLIPFNPFAYYLAGFLMAIGITVGFIGSFISVCKYLRLTR